MAPSLIRLSLEMGVFKVRPARRGDAEAIKAVLSESGFQADAATANWIINHPEMELMVAADSLERAIGVLVLSHRPQLRFASRVATIEELFVAKAWRRQGVGRELLKRAVERAHVLGVKQIEIQNLGGSADQALPFFSACGFQKADALLFRST